MKFRETIRHNFWLKVLSLAFAVITWFYVVAAIEIEQSADQPNYNLFAYKLSAKMVPIRPVFVNAPGRGYVLVKDKTEVVPGQVLLVAPRNILDQIVYVPTAPIDLQRYTRSFSQEFPLAPIGSLIIPQQAHVQVKVVIQKVTD